MITPDCPICGGTHWPGMPHQTAQNDQGLDDSGNEVTDAPESVGAKCAVEGASPGFDRKTYQRGYMKKYMADRRAKLKAQSPKPTTSA